MPQGPTSSGRTHEFRKDPGVPHGPRNTPGTHESGRDPGVWGGTQTRVLQGHPPHPCPQAPPWHTLGWQHRPQELCSRKALYWDVGLHRRRVGLLGDRDLAPRAAGFQERHPAPTEPGWYGDGSHSAVGLAHANRCGPRALGCCKNEGAWLHPPSPASPPSVKHLFQIGVQEHPGGVQLLPDRAEFGEGRIHLLKVLPGAAVRLRETECPGEGGAGPGPSTTVVSPCRCGGTSIPSRCAQGGQQTGEQGKTE